MTIPQMAALMPFPSMRDAQLADQTLEELQSLSAGSLPSVSCTVEDQRIVLSGSVSSFYRKQMAQERVRQCLGTDVTITNDLQVVRNS